jgi:hypothetical protein
MHLLQLPCQALGIRDNSFKYSEITLESLYLTV